MSTQMEPAALTTETVEDKSLEHVNQILGPNAEVKTMPRPQELDAHAQVEDQDPDMVALRELESEAAKDKTPEETPTEEELKDAMPGKTDQKPAEPQHKQDQIMIPKARLDQEIRRREDAENKLNYVKGLADARKGMMNTSESKTDEPVKPQGPTLQELLTQLDAKRIELAEKYDKGEITSVEWERQRLGLDQEARNLETKIDEDRISAIHTEAKQTATQAVQKAELDRQAAELEKKHPYCANMRERDWAYLREVATEQLLSEGHFTPNQLAADLAGQMAFRQRLAELTDTLGATLIGKTPITTGKPSSVQPQVTPTQEAEKGKEPLSDAAKARKEKLALSKQQPPTTSTLGNGGTQNELSEADILNMSEEDLAALPKSTLQRLTGR